MGRLKLPWRQGGKEATNDQSMADCILLALKKMSAELTERNDNLRMQPCDTFIIGYFLCCV